MHTAILHGEAEGADVHFFGVLVLVQAAPVILSGTHPGAWLGWNGT